MRQGRRALGVGLALALATVFPACSVAAEDDAAHALAQKFAGGPAAKEGAGGSHATEKTQDARGAEDAKKAADARKAELKRKADEARRTAESKRKSDEAEMLARAREEALERRADQERASAELEKAEREREEAEARRIADETAAAEARQKAEDERKTAEAARAAREAEARRIADEKAAAEARRKAEDERKSAEAARAAREVEARRAVEEQAKAELARIAREAEEKRLAEARAAEEASRRAEAERQQRLEADREAEKRKLSDQIHRAQGRAAENAAAAEPSTEAKVAAVAPQTAVPAAPETRVTVLLSMDPGDRGIRRFNKTADPMLCVGDACYLSRGPREDARRISRLQAFGPGVALGSRAEACNGQLKCVFRNVDIETARAQVQPIDLKIMRHDRREAQEVSADTSCRLDAGRLTCARAYASSDYRMWVVPESLARRADPGELEAALNAGLPEPRRAAAGGR